MYKFDKLFEPDYGKSKTYCIVIPPPNITGFLHMGHAFQCTLMDVLVRYYRMNSYAVLWKMGVDHAGIATQILIENKFPNKNSEDLLKACYSWKKKSFDNIVSQLTKLNCSLYLKSSRFTLDNHFSYAVKKAFIKLYDDGLIYRTKKLVNWDTKLKTAISDLEVVYKEEEAKIYFIKYKIIGEENKYLIISTGRPETIFGDVAVALNCDDERAQYFKNKKVEVPIIKRVIPVILDKYVDTTFGSGCLKITPGHDFNDFDIGLKFNLPIINILNNDGSLNNNVPLEYRGIKIKEARKKVLNNLVINNLLENIVSYKTKVPRADRSDSLVEPFLTNQWYINVKPLIDPVLAVIKEDKIKIIPSKWKNNFIIWGENIKDWCISRQIWWGHKIPAWYDSSFNFYVAENEFIVRKKFGIRSCINLVQDNDVLDTWFSSALWPFASLGWPLMKREYVKFYPTNTLVTGFDIIFFWAIRMLMFGLKFTGQVPFKEIYIHGLIRDNFGNKMSKTKGNVIDPVDIIDGITYKKLIEKRTFDLMNLKYRNLILKTTKEQFPNGIKPFGVDALRFFFMSIATESIFLKFDFNKLEKCKRLCNKLFNAKIFIMYKINCVSFYFYGDKSNCFYNIWIFSIWQRFKKLFNSNIKNRKFMFLINNFNRFFWKLFCDWYIEFVKILINMPKYSFKTVECINSIFNEILLVLYPIVPNLVDQISKTYFLKGGEFNLKSYPVHNYKFINFEKEKLFFFLKDICTKLRSFKNSFEKEIVLLLVFSSIYDIKVFEKVRSMIFRFCNVKHMFIFNENNFDFKYIKMSILSFFIIIPVFIIDYEKIIVKNKLDKMNAQKDFLNKRLNNNFFLEKAKKCVVKNTQKRFKKILKEIRNLDYLLS